MWVARVDEGWVFGDLTPQHVETLSGIPMLLESDDPRVRARLLPETCDDERREAEWRAHAVPELERLFASRGQLVARDLAALRPMPQGDTKLLLIPDGHANAWLAALNAARLALFVLNDLTAEAMEAEFWPKATPRQQKALRTIHLFAEIQSVLLGDMDLESTGPLADFPL